MTKQHCRKEESRKEWFSSPTKSEDGFISKGADFRLKLGTVVKDEEVLEINK